VTEGLAVDAAPGSSSDPLRVRDEPCPPSHQTGDLIGGFRILERIDEGVEASLYLVERVTRPRSPLVAQQEPRGVLVLTTARRGRVDPDRFAEQTRRLAGVEHRALARPRHGGVTSDGRVWVVYDEIAGETLDAYCDARSLGVEQRIRLALDVLGALARAHAQLVLHCFVAPELLRVIDRGDGPAVAVLGFGLHGLAGARAAYGDAEAGKEAPPSVLASPEEVLGQPRSTVSDVYRVGLELQRLLLGARPENELRGEDPESWVRAMVERAMTDPAERFAALPPEEQQRIASARGTTPRALVERVRGELGDMLRCTLAEEATERPSSADALALRLERWLAGERSGPARADRRSRRRWAALVAGALLVLAAGAVGWWRGAQRPREALRIDAAVDRVLAESLGAPPWPARPGTDEVLPAAVEPRLEGADAGFTVELLARLAEIAAAHDDRQRAAALHASAVERAAEAFGAQSPQVAASRLRQARTALALGLEDAGQAARHALDAARASDAGPAVLLEARLLVGEALAEQAPAEAIGLADQLIADLEAPPWWRRAAVVRWPAAGDRDGFLLRAQLVRGRALAAEERYPEAMAALTAAAQAPAAAREPRLASEAWRLLAAATASAGEPVAAHVELLERALAARIDAAGERDPVALELAERLAEAMAAAGRLEGAIARAARTAELAGEGETRARSLEQVGRWQLAAGRPAEAAASFDSALEVLEPRSADAHRLALARIDARMRAGDAAAAAAALDQLPAVEAAEASASGRVARARVLAALGRAEAAVALREALDALRVAGSAEAPAAVPALLALGETLLADGDSLVAEAYLRRALAILEGSSAPAYRVAEARSALGEALLAQNRREEAQALLREAASELAGRDDLPAREARRRLGLLGDAAGS
jgi:eukaryotic-like serine/threonine-protein kinase